MHIEVARAELARVRVDETPAPALATGEARVAIDAFGLSSNNVTYAVFGDALRYWEFFPAGGDVDDGWGRIPVWGFGEVVESRSPEVEIGERLYGYFPMGDELVLVPGRADERGLADVAPHRADMAAAYSRYVRCATDPLHRADREDHQMLLYPLFVTSFLIDDFLTDHDGFGAEQLVVSSASSKTAIGVAYLAHQRGARVVGLTSAANAAFVEGLDVYDEVRPYEAVGELAVVPSVYIDIAGNVDVLHAVHRRLEGVLAHSMTVGDTHWDHQAAVAEAPPPPAPEFFFAPTQIAKRTDDWGRDELDRRMGEGWNSYTAWADSWIDFRHVRGAAAVIDVYHELLGGHPDPRAGFICSLRP